MGFLDKAKAQAQQLATKGQEKLEQTQAKRKSDGLLRDLGAAVFKQKSGSGGPDVDSEIERLVSELRAHEVEHGKIDTTPTADQQQSGDVDGDDV
jgi:hypothetical protein